MNEIFLIGCSAAKKHGDYPTKAKDLYQGQLFKKCRQLAELSKTPWYILSALYGLVHPEQPIGNYNQRMQDLTGLERLSWAEKVVDDLKEELAPLPQKPVISIFAGELYWNHIGPLLESQGFQTIELPLAGFGIGYQLSKMNLLLSRYIDVAKAEGKAVQGDLL